MSKCSSHIILTAAAITLTAACHINLTLKYKGYLVFCLVAGGGGGGVGQHLSGEVGSRKYLNRSCSFQLDARFQEMAHPYLNIQTVFQPWIGLPTRFCLHGIVIRERNFKIFKI